MSRPVICEVCGLCINPDDTKEIRHIRLIDDNDKLVRPEVECCSVCMTNISLAIEEEIKKIKDSDKEKGKEKEGKEGKNANNNHQ